MRVGLVGTGGMGGAHSRQYVQMADVELRVFDIDPDRRAAHEAKFGVSGSESLEALISWADVIDVCLPTPVHAEVALKAIAAGRHVFIEKPVTSTLEEAFAVREAASKAGVQVMPGQVVRFFPEYARAHEVVKSGQVGKPAAARARRGGGAPTGSKGWFMDHKQSGGTLLDLAIHDFDWLRWTLGEVTQVYARSVGAQTGSGPDYSLTTLSFDSGAVAHVEATWMDPSGFWTAFEVAGSEGLIQFDSRSNAAVQTTVRDKNTGLPLVQRDGNLSPDGDPYFRELRGFLDSVAAGTPPPVTIDDGIAALAIGLAALESAQTGRVTVPTKG